jgi:hypothetical protein
MFIVINNFTDNYRPLVDKTWYLNKLPYCEKHGYSHELQFLESSLPMHEYQIEKIKFIQRVVNDSPEDSWIWWTGADLMITNFLIKLEDIVDNNYHFVTATDFNGINADSFLIRNSQQGRDYLNMIAEKLPNYTHWEGEQGIMKDTYEQYKDIVIKLVPQRTMNSYNYSLYKGRGPEPMLDKLGNVGDWRIGDFAIHWPAQSLEFRLQAFDYYSQFIIRQ